MSAQNPPSIRVFLISDFRLLLWGLEQLIGSAQRGMTVVGSTTHYAEALTRLGQAMPDVILLDLDPGNESGIDAITQLTKESNAKILALMASRDNALHDKAVMAGARGVAVRDMPVEALLTAIEKIHQGQYWVDRAASGRIFVELSRMTVARAESPEHLKIQALTAREKEIITAMLSATGAPAKVIADKLKISESTLRNHLTSVYEKLGVASRLSLYDFAQRNGLSGQSHPQQAPAGRNQH